MRKTIVFLFALIPMGIMAQGETNNPDVEDCLDSIRFYMVEMDKSMEQMQHLGVDEIVASDATPLSATIKISDDVLVEMDVLLRDLDRNFQSLCRFFIPEEEMEIDDNLTNADCFIDKALNQNDGLSNQTSYTEAERKQALKERNGYLLASMEEFLMPLRALCDKHQGSTIILLKSG